MCVGMLGFDDEGKKHDAGSTACLYEFDGFVCLGGGRFGWIIRNKGLVWVWLLECELLIIKLE